MTVLAENLKTIRKHLHCTQMAISEVLELGFRTYVRYEAGERDAPVSLMVKLARLGNVSLDRLLTTKIQPDDLLVPDTDKPPKSSRKLMIVGGSLDEGRLMFKGSRKDFYVTANNSEKKLLTQFRKLSRVNKDQFLLDMEWMLNNTKALSTVKRKVSRKVQKAKIATRLRKVAKTVKKITLKG